MVKFDTQDCVGEGRRTLGFSVAFNGAVDCTITGAAGIAREMLSVEVGLVDVV